MEGPSDRPPVPFAAHQVGGPAVSVGSPAQAPRWLTAQKALAIASFLAGSGEGLPKKFTFSAYFQGVPNMRTILSLVVALGLISAPVFAEDAAPAKAEKADKAEKKADKAEKKADKAEKKADKAEKKADKAEKKADKAEKKAEAK